MWLLGMGLAMAGYGDPVDGRPSPAERELHLWTNAVRVDPEAFSADYLDGGCDFGGFSAAEQSPKVPLTLDADLAEAARAHTDDMQSTGVLSHDSSDGTPFEQRINGYYSGLQAGENVQNGFSTNLRAAVASGWMCSPGHRANILAAGFDELGVGVAGSFMTQDFGGPEGPREIAMAAQFPSQPQQTATIRADWSGPAPEGLFAWVNGQPHAMHLEFGDKDQGVYAVDIDVVSSCTEYWILGDGVTFPEKGSYGWGDCDWHDADAQWVNRQLRGEDDEAKEDGCGCATGPLGGGWWVVLLALSRSRRATRARPGRS